MISKKCQLKLFIISNPLEGKNIAILATDGFEEVECVEPKKALEEAGAVTHVIAPHDGKIKAWDHDNWGGEYEVDKTVEDVSPEDYDNLMLPGGVMNPDQLRMNERAIQFVTSFLRAGKPVAAICHAPQLLIETGEIDGKTLTSYPSLKTDLVNAGAHWIDKEVVVDQGLTTSRKPDDIPAFNNKMIEEFAEGMHAELASN